MNIKVFKFGGASVRNAEKIKNVAKIMVDHADQKIVVVISAMGKITNALEEVVKAYYNGKGDAKLLVDKIKAEHYQVVDDLFEQPDSMKNELNDLFVEIDWILEEEIEDTYDYLYDQIVSIGELASTKIVAAYLLSLGLKSVWQDVRDILFTDESYREAQVNWELTNRKTKEILSNKFKENDLIVTQGFIGSTLENTTTTLGREGSDYTAGILAYSMDAESMHIWKDVPGILTADPSQFDNVLLMDRLSYKEAVEMTYYGAKVIHPKTIKPLQNKSIPMYVRPFETPENMGTLITEDIGTQYPPVIVIEPNQCLLHISTKDFSFVAEHHLSKLFQLLAEFRIKVNMMRNTAISFSISVNSNPRKLDRFIEALSTDFKVFMDRDLELITVRHYNEITLNSMKKNKIVLLEEKLKDTVRIVVRDVPSVSRK